MFKYLKNLIFANFFKKLLALSLATLFWWFYTKDATTENYTVIQVPVTYSGINADFAIVSDLLKSVQVTLKSNQPFISNDMSNYQVAIDISKLKLGNNLYQLSADDFTGPKDKVWDIYPENVDIKLDKKITKQMKVALNFQQKLSKSALQNIYFYPNFVNLIGPDSSLSQLQEISTEEIDYYQLLDQNKISVALRLPKFVIIEEPTLIMIETKTAN